MAIASKTVGQMARDFGNCEYISKILGDGIALNGDSVSLEQTLAGMSLAADIILSDGIINE